MKKAVLKKVLAVLIVLGIMIVCVHEMASPSAVNWQEDARIITYTVESGDTLWSIAQRYRPDCVDVRIYIDEICELNNITPSIDVGQRIQLYEMR